MKPIIVILLSLPIVAFLHHNSKQPVSYAVTKSTVVSKKSPAKPAATPVAAKASKATTPVASTAVPASTPAVTAPTPVVYPTSCQAYVSTISQYSWNVSVAVAIMQAESGCNPNAISNAAINFDGISDYGLFQLHGMDILNPYDNVAAAYQKYLSQGWAAWSTYNSDAYLRFLQ